MRKGARGLVFCAGILCGAAAALVVYRKHQDSYERMPEEEQEFESDFVAVDEQDDGFDYIVDDQILFSE